MNMASTLQKKQNTEVDLVLLVGQVVLAARIHNIHNVYLYMSSRLVKKTSKKGRSGSDLSENTDRTLCHLLRRYCVRSTLKRQHILKILESQPL